MTVYYCFSPSRVILPLSKHLQSKIIASEATGGFVINDGIQRNCHFVNLILIKVNKIFLPIYLSWFVGFLSSCPTDNYDIASCRWCSYFEQVNKFVPSKVVFPKVKKKYYAKAISSSNTCNWRTKVRFCIHCEFIVLIGQLKEAWLC